MELRAVMKPGTAIVHPSWELNFHVSYPLATVSTSSTSNLYSSSDDKMNCWIILVLVCTVVQCSSTLPVTHLSSSPDVNT